MVNRQLHELGLKLHPRLAHRVQEDEDGGHTFNGQKFSFVSTGLLVPTKHHERLGRDDRGDSEMTVESIANDLRTGRGLENPLNLGYHVGDHGGNVWIDEGHHRLEAALRAGTPVLPVVSNRDKWGAPSNAAGLVVPQGLKPDRYGWSPGTYDPEELVRGARR